MLGGGKKDRWVWEVGTCGEVGGIWGCLDKSVGAGLDGQRDGGERGSQITATNFLAQPMSSFCGQLTCHIWVDMQRHQVLAAVALNVPSSLLRLRALKKSGCRCFRLGAWNGEGSFHFSLSA